MITSVEIHHFKRFQEVKFAIDGHIVLAGPNNMGKTTLLQAISAWSFGFQRWKESNFAQRHHGQYPMVPITRQAFSSVPLLKFDLLWNDRRYNENIEIRISSSEGWSVALEFIPDSTEQIYVRPKPDIEPEKIRSIDLKTVFVPPMTGLSTEEPVYTRPKLDQMLGMGKPGDIIRNLLVEAHQSPAWQELTDSIRRLFGFELLPPDARGADIIAEYQTRKNGPKFDIASAGSGFQQVLMLLTFLHTRPASVLLLDEPDAHLHIILQDVIYSELKSVASKQNSQLIISTHSEVIINSVDISELCLVLDKPKLVSSITEKKALAQALRVLSHTDIMQAENAPGILYLENYTDLDILREWARILNHPTYNVLVKNLFWKPLVSEPAEGIAGIRSTDHYRALRLVRRNLPALELVDGDARQEIKDSEITGRDYQRARWRRYEIESYLLHPGALARFINKIVGSSASVHVEEMLSYFKKNFTPGIVADPLGDHVYLKTTKARTLLIPPLLEAAGIKNFPYTRYHEIAAIMLPEEIHLEVKEKLDIIHKAFFGLQRTEQLPLDDFV
jgi:ABC-type transport system involved in cytochrome c biogenesis ATPase subunit